MLVVFLNIGILVAYLVGAYIPYHIAPFVLIVFPILFFVGSVFLPDTPRFLLLNGHRKAAEKSLRFYAGCTRRGIGNTEQRFADEMKKLEAFVSHQQSIADTKVHFSDFCTPAAVRGMLIGSALMVLNILSGTLLLLNYASSIFSNSGSDLDPNTSSIIMITVQLAGTYVATFLIDRVGRRVLLITSCLGSATGMTIMGVFSYLASLDMYDLSDLNWVPVASVSMALFSSSIGLMPLVFVVLAEVLPNKVNYY